MGQVKMGWTGPTRPIDDPYLLEFWTIELFVQIAESLEIERVLSNHLTCGNHIVWVFELTMLKMALSKIV